MKTNLRLTRYDTILKYFALESVVLWNSIVFKILCGCWNRLSTKIYRHHRTK